MEYKKLIQEETFPTTQGTIHFLVVDTPDKYIDKQHDIVPKLIKLLQDICLLEDETFTQQEIYDSEKPSLGLENHIEHPKSRELFYAYKKRYEELLQNLCTEELISRGYAQSFRRPAKYSYINTNCTLYFSMKTEKKAEVQIFYEDNTRKDKFVFRPFEDGWKIAEMYYGFTRDNSFYKFRM